MKIEGGVPYPHFVGGHWGWDHLGQQQSRGGGGGGKTKIFVFWWRLRGGGQQDLIRVQKVHIILSGGERETHYKHITHRSAIAAKHY